MAGPLITVDKSALQGLSHRELLFLEKHYFTNVPPILITEVLGDLAKKPSGLRDPNAPMVQILAGRVNGLEGVVLMHHTQICLGNLLGRIGMPEYRQGIVHGRSVKTEDGQVGGFSDQDEKLALVLWSEGRFTDVDRLLAAAWRDLSQRLDAKGYVDHLSRLDVILPHTKSINEVRGVVDDLLRNPHLQLPLLRFLLNEFQYAGRYQTAALKRWVASEAIFLRQTAPYAEFCIRVLLTFAIASRHRLVPRRPTNRIDLEYLFYAPFTNIFCSDDRFHRALAPLLLDEDQCFLGGTELKHDLAAIADEWDALSEEQRRARGKERGPYPPEQPPTKTAEMWARYCRPWEPGMGYLELTDDQQKSLIEHLRPIMKAIRESQGHTPDE